MKINKIELGTNIKCRFTKKGNIKLGGMWSFSTLYGNDDYVTDWGKISGTCGHYCEGCKSNCYVAKSYRYPSVIKGHARNTLALMDILEAEKSLIEQIKRAKNKPSIIRIHQTISQQQSC